ncbi:outer membrane lipoprotein carrier protein LolA [Alisedimentitalea sp. MJ-SS2]|uniref:LolA family protein n=1 Tax=Aliisedimentitalea sp. MJ-SS2 TaxID=3049795 RepID=UPI00290A2789|nr:outer membrane lipoprotein carrier protein LolA [Alisedimentitalea sp. MJ-SS2]MDU8929259.1 outer membrane lipoprotein carrier protein LolA [Alisedimentitalea sp. MJ-SS2]
MKLSRLILATATTIALALPASADKQSLNAISKYLNGMKQAKTKFTQINDDGTIDTGTIYIKRPGKMRFEYDPPNKALVLVSAATVALFDPKTNQGPETYPLNKTPLSIILAKTVNLAQANMVTGHSYDGTATIVTAQDPKHPEYGNIQLKFTGNPVELRQWIINDDSGSSTTVVLGALSKGGSMPHKLFDIDLNTNTFNR